MKAKRLITTRQLPKTGAVTPVTAGHDGFYQAGWWRGRKIADNKPRFIAKTINENKVVIDRATGLMWAADGSAEGCNSGALINFADAIIYAEGLTFAGFSDWRLANVYELFSITDMSLDAPCINESFFPNCNRDYTITSTTYAGDILRCMYVDFDSIRVDDGLKTSTNYIRCVRGGL